MDSEYIQHVRYKLQKRQKRLNTADFQTFHWTLLQAWGFLQENEITKGILDDLERRFPATEQDADKTIAGQPQIGSTESENDAICYWVAKKCVLSGKPDVEIQVGHQLSTGGKHDEAIEAFRLAYIEPLFDYIDEQIDDKRMVLVLLKKFKHRCEWFRRAGMTEATNSDERDWQKQFEAEQSHMLGVARKNWREIIAQNVNNWLGKRLDPAWSGNDDDIFGSHTAFIQFAVNNSDPFPAIRI